MKKMMLLLSALIFVSLPVMAQDENAKTPPPPIHFYHLTYNVQEVSDTGKVTNSRTYATHVSTEKNVETGRMRVGNRIPVCDDIPTAKCSDPNATHQVQYLDSGISIDNNHIAEIDGKLSLNVTADMTSLAKSADTDNHPIVRNNRWSAAIVVPIGKPTVIFSSDNESSKGKIQVELTATRVE